MRNVRTFSLTVGLLIAVVAAPPSPAAEQAPPVGTITDVEAFQRSPVPRGGPQTVTPSLRSAPRHLQRDSEQRDVEVDAKTAGVVVHTDEDRGRQLTKWAVGRYREAGLILPTLVIHFHPTMEGCDGNFGLRTQAAAGHRLDICARDQAGQERVLLHEIAHAWTAENLSFTQQEAFLVLRGLDVWTHADTKWSRRGTEQAAEIIAWGLAETCGEPRIPNRAPADVSAAFELLTGTQPLCEREAGDTRIPERVDEGREGGPRA